jgi:hypothetical protein
MSSAFKAVAKPFVSVGKSVLGLDKQKDKINAAQAAQDAELAQRQRSEAALQEKLRVSQIDERRQQAGAAASAAGATRSGSDRDLLGFTPPVKRRASSRVLLGE